MKTVQASLTIEAALVMSITCILLGTCVYRSFRLHDAVLGNMVLNESIELYSHREKNSDTENRYLENGQKLNQMLSQSALSIRFSELSGGDGLSGEVTGIRYRMTQKDTGFHPEKLLRKLSLIEAFTEGQQEPED